MNCSKCGKQIPESEKTICDECQKKLLEEIEKENLAEEKEEVAEIKNEEEKETSKKSPKLGKILLIIFILAVICGIGYFAYTFGLLDFSKEGNSIANIRNYGYMAEKGNKIYFVAPDEKGENMCIYKINKNGKNKEILLTNQWDILSLNVIGNNLYFIAIEDTNVENEEDSVNNKIYKMKLDGSELEIINDNEFHNDSYEFYAVDNKIYYIGEDTNIYSMDLNGKNKKVLNSDETGFLGVTDKYIIFNVQEKDEEANEKTITYSMKLDGTERKAITGERLYSVNVIGDELFYVNEEKHIYKANLVTGENTKISDTAAYNMNVSGNYIYFMNYCDEEYNIAIYKMKLDGTNEEKLLQLDNYSTFLDVVGNKVMYMDNNDEKGVINILDGRTKKITSLYEFVF